MTRDERMPWSTIANSFSEGGGLWAAITFVFTTICYAALGLFKLRSTAKIARDTDLAERENNLFRHLSEEISRLNTLVTDLDGALKAQAITHRAEMQRERDECNAKMAGMKGEIELLKRRMSDEEQRDA